MKDGAFSNMSDHTSLKSFVTMCGVSTRWPERLSGRWTKREYNRSFTHGIENVGFHSTVRVDGDVNSCGR